MPQGSIDVTARIIPDTSLLAQQLRTLERSGALNFSPKLNGRGFSAPLGRITGDVNKFESSLSAANQRVITFGASVGIIYGIVRAFRDLVGSVVEVDKALRQLNAIYGLSQAQLQKFGEGLFNVARQTGQSFETVAKAAQAFSSQGLNVSETLKRTRDALILVRLTGIDTADAYQQLTSILNNFNDVNGNSDIVLNKLVAVGQSYAVTAKDMATALEQTGATAKAAGASFDEMLGLIAAVKQTTGTAGPLIGRNLSIIFNRLGQSKTIEDLNQLGIATKTLEGNLRPTYDILKDLARAYEGFNRQQQNQVDQLAGGVYRANEFKALMTDLAHAEGFAAQATKVASNARDTAIQRNAAYNQSISAMATNLGTSVKEISADFGQLAFGNFLKGGLNFGQKIADVLKPDSEKGGESVGKFFGEGIAKGIGNVLTGPVLGIALAVLAKIVASTGKILVGDIGKQLNYNQISTKEVELQTGINALIAKGTQEEQERFLVTARTTEQETILLGILNRQVQAYAALGARGAVLGEQLVLSGEAGAIQQVGKQILKTGRFATGYIPGAIGAEANAVAQGIGGATSSAKPVLIPDFNFGGGQHGSVVANTSEYLVPHYAGGSAIFNREMINKFGMPPGAKPIAAGGYIPNFAGGFDARNPVSGRFLSADERKLIEIINTGRNPLTGRFVSALERQAAENQLLNRLLEQEFSKKFLSSPQVLAGRRVSMTDLRNRVDYGSNPDQLSDEYLRTQTESGNVRAAQILAARQGPDYVVQQEGGLRDGAAAIHNKILQQQAINDEQKLEQLNRYRSKQTALERAQNYRNRALGLAFVAPFLGGFVDPAFNALGIGTGGGTKGGIASGALSGGLQGAGIGGLFGVPGLAIGATAGALAGAFSKATKSVEEFAKETEDANNARQHEVASINQVQAAFANLTQAQKSGDLKESVRYQQELNEALKGVPLGSPVIVALKSGNINQLNSASEQQIKELTTTQTAAVIANTLRSGVNAGNRGDITGGFASILQTGQVSKEDITKAFAFTKETPVDIHKSADEILKEQQARSASFVSFLGKFNDQFKNIQVPASSISEAAFAVVKAFQQVTQAAQAEADAKSKTAKIGISEKGFLTGSPLQSLNQLAGLSKFPFAGGRLISREQRGGVEYNAIEELVKAAGVKPEELESVYPELYNRLQTSRYYNQRGNLLNTATDFLTGSLNTPRYQYYNPTSRLYNEQNIIGSLTRLKSGPNQTLAPEADFLLKQIGALSNTRYNLSKNPNVNLNNPLGGSINGIQIGSGYQTVAGTPHDFVERTQKFVTETLDRASKIAVKAVLQVDGTIKLISDTMSDKELSALAVVLTDRIGKHFEAQVSDINRRVSKLEGNPLPPTQSKNFIQRGDAALPSSAPVKNAQGFYTIKH